MASSFTAAVLHDSHSKMSIAPETTVLVDLGRRIEQALQKEDVRIDDFVEVCEVLFPLFDNLGPIFSYAKKEFTTKNASLGEVCGRFTTLKEIVDHDKANGVVTKKGSCARNLHRLGSALNFIMILMTELTKSLSVSLKEAANTAYLSALAPIHTYVVKNLVCAGLNALPSRATFLGRIQESEETAKMRADELFPLVERLVQYVESLYDEPMPISNTYFISY